MKKEIYLAGGCFWGLEQYLKNIHGVISTIVGYANGKTSNPSYEDVCHNNTNHAETVKVIYDNTQLGLSFLLDQFYDAIDVNTINRQGNDIGAQYRSGIYYVDKQDVNEIEQSLKQLQNKNKSKVAIEFEALANFYEAEQYHQKYLDKNPSGYCHINAKQIANAKLVFDPTKLYQVPTDTELKQNLTPLQYAVTQHASTEAPFENEFDKNFDVGIYVNIVTGEPLFYSTDKFDSGCGWPAFTKPISESKVAKRVDNSLARTRVEVLASHSNAHLGHVFEDGPKSLGGLRYCINSAALKFIPIEDMQKLGYGKYLNELNKQLNK